MLNTFIALQPGDVNHYGGPMSRPDAIRSVTGSPSILPDISTVSFTDLVLY
jgi:hypothetical protein